MTAKTLKVVESGSPTFEAADPQKYAEMNQYTPKALQALKRNEIRYPR